MSAVAGCYKVEIIGLHRIQGCEDRLFARQSDGRGRQTIDPVSIVDSSLIQIVAGDVALEVLAHAIDYGRV